MCGRYTLIHPTEEILERFGLKQLELPIAPRYNIAPSQLIAIIIANQRPGNSGRLLEAARWGFLPSWSHDIKRTPPMINARSESASEKPTFRTAFRSRRCLIPADSFYEWQGEGKSRKPWRFHLKGERLFAFAGLFEDFASGDGDEIRTCTILTVAANDKMRPFHDRMPVILPRQLEGLWLDPQNKDVDQLQALLRPYPDDQIEMHRVGTAVNGTKVDSPDLIKLLDASEEDGPPQTRFSEVDGSAPGGEPKKIDKKTAARRKSQASSGQLSLFDFNQD